VSAVERVASADGTEIAYRAVGDGEPVLFVHGSGTSGADWAFTLPFLRERFTVVTMDRRGRGRSGDAAEYAMEREAEDVLAVLDAAGAEKLVAHSYGALCSILAVQKTDRVRRLVLYEPPIAVRKHRPVERLKEMLAAGEADAAMEGFLASAGTPPEQLATIRSSQAWPVLLDALPALPRELDAAAEWRSPAGPIDIPTLFLLGANTDNPVYLDGIGDLRAAFRHHRSETIPGQKHVAHVFAAEAFAELIGAFLADPGGYT
jgi:pimeloyl-ACP methyl ester carboxylesterase